MGGREAGGFESGQQSSGGAGKQGGAQPASPDG
jgi:hypothetical protein